MLSKGKGMRLKLQNSQIETVIAASTASALPAPQVRCPQLTWLIGLANQQVNSAILPFVARPIRQSN